MDQGRNRVFINPNFNKGTNNNGLTRQVPVMHVNPYFCPHEQKTEPVPKAKIYINPNFVRPNAITNQVPFINAHHSFGKPISLIDSSNNVCASVVKTHENNITVSVKPPSSEPFPTLSRYSLVRQKEIRLPQTVPTNTQTQTVKIGKYKSIKITEMRKTLDTVKPLNAEKSTIKVTTKHNSAIPIIATNNVHLKSPNTHVNKYKILRPSVRVFNKPQFKRQLSNNSRKVVCSRTHVKTFGVYKKNNIPCPQYRKYGKCLRKLHGKCDFLHDKKHVSICRKFLNGVCHDSECLLSHEVSDKKLPTCYFYLKGMCTKEGCPYLHVKLNEKAKVCSDFIRGYCENGDKCLNRHTTKSLNGDRKRRHSIRKKSPQKSMKYKVENNRKKNIINNCESKKSKTQLQLSSSQDKNESGSRYYKESVEETSNSESLEVIKPTRCKLGTLPSFIQL